MIEQFRGTAETAGTTRDHATGSHRPRHFDDGLAARLLSRCLRRGKRRSPPVPGRGWRIAAMMGDDDHSPKVTSMTDRPDATIRIMIMRSFLAQSGARSAGVAKLMLEREYPEATEEERRAAIEASHTAVGRS